MSLALLPFYEKEVKNIINYTLDHPSDVTWEYASPDLAGGGVLLIECWHYEKE